MAIVNIKRKLNFMLARLCRLNAWKRIPSKLRVRFIAPERPRRVPFRVQIEATSKCNLRCPCCSHSREQDAGQHLLKEDFRRILDCLPWSPKRVVLSGIGEPLMNPHFFSMVDILAERNIKCEFFTNGTLLTERMQKAILSRPNIDTIIISCDGAEKATFEALRVGANFESWKRSVREFVSAARRRQGPAMCLSLNIVVNKRNLNEVENIIRLAAELGFDSVGVLHPIPVDDVAAALCPSATELSTVRQEDLFELAEGLGLKIIFFFHRAASLPELMPRCMQPWEYVFIRANGDITPCCAIFGSDKGAVVGNIFQQQFNDIWHGERFREFRKTSVSGTNALCRICPYY